MQSITFCGVIDKMCSCLGYPHALYSSFQPTCWLYVPHAAKSIRGSCQGGRTYTAASDARSCGSWTPPHLESWHRSVQNCRYRCCLCDCAPFPGVHRGQEIAAFSRNTGSTGNRPYSRCSVPAPEIKLTMPKFRWYGMKLKKTTQKFTVYTPEIKLTSLNSDSMEWSWKHNPKL